MKAFRILGSALAILALSVFTGCDDEDDNTTSTTVSVSPTSLVFDIDGGEKTVSVTCDGQWYADNTAEWITLSQESGKGDATVTVVAAANVTNGSARSANITFEDASGTSSVSVLVNQSGGSGATSLSLDKDALSFDANGGYQNVAVTADGDWTASVSADWVTLSMESSSGSASVRVTVDGNDGDERNAEVTFMGNSNVTATLTVSQGKAVQGEGTADSPYTVSDAISIIDFGIYGTDKVYVKGIISQIDDIDTYTYGYATYHISDDGKTADQLEVYLGYGLGGVKFTSTNDIKVGDEVVVFGAFTTSGSTPEIAEGSIIHSLNGEILKGSMTSPYTVAEALEIINAGTNTVYPVYVKGIISRISSVSTDYGNAEYYISDSGSTSNQLHIYWGYYLGGAFFSSSSDISVGDEVIEYGVLNMYGSTPEIYGASLYYLNGKTVEMTLGDIDESDPYVANVWWTPDRFAIYGVAYINGGNTRYNVIKLGSASSCGSALCMLPAGTKSVQFYTVAWNSANAPFKVTVGSYSFESTAIICSTVTGSATFTASVSDSDFYECTFSSPLAEETALTFETTSTSGTRLLIIGMKYILD